MPRGVPIKSIALVILLAVFMSLPAGGYAVVLDDDLIAGVPFAERGLLASQMVDIDAPAGYLVTRSGQVLWSRNASDRRSIASITKVMTAILALEQGNLDDMVTVSYEAATIGGSTADLSEGESYPLRDMIKMMLSVSGNDAAVSIAQYLGDRITSQNAGQSGEAFDRQGAFVSMMNAKATELGMHDTHFENPQGYDDPAHYSSAQDVATMVAYAMKLPLFREIVADPGGPESPFQNTNELLRTFEGANGVKTGMTDEAGNCVAASALRNAIELYAVVLGSDTEESRFIEASKLLTFGFDHYGPHTLIDGGTVLGTTTVTDYLDVEVDVGVKTDMEAIYFDLLGPIEQTIEIDPISAPVEVGTTVGFITFTQDGTQIARQPIVSFEAVAKPGFFEALRIAWTRLVRSFSRREVSLGFPSAPCAHVLLVPSTQEAS